MKTTACSETDLIERAASDLDAFGELVERYRGSIQRQCYSSVRDRDYAEDLAQETFILAYLKLGQLKDLTRFPNWLRKIASNVCHEFARNTARRESPSEVLPELVEHSDVRPATPTAVLDALSPETRACIDLFYNAGLSYLEIAQALDMTVASVKARLQRAKAVLRKEMAETMPEPKSAFTQRVIDKLRGLESSDPKDRVGAARELRAGLEADRIEELLLLLRNDHQYERYAAVKVSRKHPSPRVRDALVDVLLNDPAEEVRHRAAGALVAQRDPTVIPYLRQAMQAPGNPREVVSAAKSAIKQLEDMEMPVSPEIEERRLRQDLGKASSDARARAELLKRLKTALQDPEPSVRNQAIKALVELGDKRAAPAIVKLLDDPFSGIRQAAAVALGDLGSGVGLTALLRVLGDWSGRDLQAVLVALNKIADHRAMPHLLKFMERNRNADLIVMAKNPIVAIIEADDLMGLKQSISLAKGACEETRDLPHFGWIWSAALARAADIRHVGEIAELLESGVHEWGLFDALGRIGGAESLALLKQYLYARSCDAAEALVSFGEPGWQVLREALYSDDSDVRFAACARMMFAGGDPASVERFQYLADTATDSKMRMYAQFARVKSTESEAKRKQRLERRREAIREAT